MTTDRPLVRMLHQACAFNALTACIVILEESVEDTSYVQDIIDLLQGRADEVERDIESMLDQLSEAGPKCVRLGYCPEKGGCGRCPPKRSSEEVDG